MIHINLESKEQQTLVKSQLETLSTPDTEALESIEPNLNITAVIDGRGWACPMPLLKTKVALRSMQVGESVYVLATDPNSETDLAAFCQQMGLKLALSTQTAPSTSSSLEKLDTIFHLFITKTNGN